jgi:hypothetical protein
MYSFNRVFWAGVQFFLRSCEHWCVNVIGEVDEWVDTLRWLFGFCNCSETEDPEAREEVRDFV